MHEVRAGDTSLSLPAVGPVVIQLDGLVSGAAHPLEGRYVWAYNPGPASMPLRQCLLMTTRDVRRAKVYASHQAAHAEWTRVDPREPVGPSGRPNRPMTAWNVSILPAPNANDNSSA